MSAVSDRTFKAALVLLVVMTLVQLGARWARRVSPGPATSAWAK